MQPSPFPALKLWGLLPSGKKMLRAPAPEVQVDGGVCSPCRLPSREKLTSPSFLLTRLGDCKASLPPTELLKGQARSVTRGLAASCRAFLKEDRKRAKMAQAVPQFLPLIPVSAKHQGLCEIQFVERTLFPP